MKIALSFPGCHRRGGVERVVLECANFLQARGHETHMYASEFDEESLHASIVRHHVDAMTRPRLARILSYTRNCQVAMRADRDLTDVHGAFSVMSPIGGVAWMGSVHKAWLDISRRERDLKGRLKQRLNLCHPAILALEKRYIVGRNYKRLLTVGGGVKADLVKFYGVPESEIEVLPNGYMPAEFNYATGSSIRYEMRTELGYKASDRVIVFVANELERKGFGPLLRSIAALKRSDVHLLAVGHLNPAVYEAEVAHLGMKDRVRYTGPTDKVARYYAAADIFGLPTQYEAWGLVIVEAMACGLPVLTSRLAGASVTIREGKSGRLLEDPRNVKEITQNLQLLLDGEHDEPAAIAESVLQYSWDSVLLRYEEVLRSACGNRQ